MKEYTFVFTEEQANIILNALSVRPYVEVAELIATIHKQAEEQQGEPRAEV